VRNRVETRINAPRDTVWKVIADFPRYPEWNPFTPEVIGRCAAGEEVRAKVKLDGDPFWMKRRVTEAEPDRRFVWEGREWYSALTPGLRSLTLEDDGAGGTLLVDDEYVGGLMVLAPRRLEETIGRRMRQFGAGLKAAAEARAAARAEG